MVDTAKKYDIKLDIVFQEDLILEFGDKVNFIINLSL
jgi:hypothetical protein